VTVTKNLDDRYKNLDDRYKIATTVTKNQDDRYKKSRRPLQNCDGRYKIATAVTKLRQSLQNYRDVTVKRNVEIPGDTKVLAFLDIVHTPTGSFTPNFGRILDDCVFQGPQDRYTP